MTNVRALRPKHQEESATREKCQERKAMGTHLEPQIGLRGKPQSDTGVLVRG